MSDSQPSSIPNILFKYLDANGGLATLNHAEGVRVMFSKPSDLNDPCEFLPSLKGLVRIPNRWVAKYPYLVSPLRSACADHWRRKIEENWFISSLTSADNNVRMWAQYGGNHEGLKLTFNFDESVISEKGNKIHVEDKMIVKIDYGTDERVDISELYKSRDHGGQLLKKVASRKGRDWQHEEEYRWFLRDDKVVGGKRGSLDDSKEKAEVSKQIVNRKMRSFLHLPHSCIQKVTMGYRSNPSLLRSVLELRKMHNAKWDVAKTILSVETFKFEDELVCEN